jgi:hypothetical protein
MITVAISTEVEEDLTYAEPLKIHEAGFYVFTFSDVEKIVTMTTDFYVDIYYVPGFHLYRFAIPFSELNEGKTYKSDDRLVYITVRLEPREAFNKLEGIHIVVRVEEVKVAIEDSNMLKKLMNDMENHKVVLRANVQRRSDMMKTRSIYLARPQKIVTKDRMRCYTWLSEVARFALDTESVSASEYVENVERMKYVPHNTVRGLRVSPSYDRNDVAKRSEGRNKERNEEKKVAKGWRSLSQNNTRDLEKKPSNVVRGIRGSVSQNSASPLDKHRAHVMKGLRRNVSHNDVESLESVSDSKEEMKPRRNTVEQEDEHVKEKKRGIQLRAKGEREGSKVEERMQEKGREREEKEGGKRRGELHVSTREKGIGKGFEGVGNLTEEDLHDHAKIQKGAIVTPRETPYEQDSDKFINHNACLPIRLTEGEMLVLQVFNLKFTPPRFAEFRFKWIEFENAKDYTYESLEDPFFYFTFEVRKDEKDIKIGTISIRIKEYRKVLNCLGDSKILHTI